MCHIYVSHYGIPTNIGIHENLKTFRKTHVLESFLKKIIRTAYF